MGLNSAKGDENVFDNLRWGGRRINVRSPVVDTAHSDGDSSCGFDERTSVIADSNLGSRTIPNTGYTSVAAARGAETSPEQRRGQEHFPRKVRMARTLHENDLVRSATPATLANIPEFNQLIGPLVASSSQVNANTYMPRKTNGLLAKLTVA